MKFSIILPSYLGEYKNAASNRETKLIRAINSVLSQSFEDYELIVVSDGCDKTMELVTPLVYEHLPKVRLLQIPKQKIWSGSVRNAGIFKAEGEIIIYIDADDYWGVDHLKIVNKGFGDNDWVYFNDWNGKTKKENLTQLRLGACGTSTIAHKRSLGVYWTCDTYAHDWIFIQHLLQFPKYTKINTPEYWVCHIPGEWER